MSKADDWDRIPWWEAEADRLKREQEAMTEKAPEMEWTDDLPAKGWRGLAPEWPMRRPRPEKLNKLLDGKRLRLEVQYSQGYPAQAPRLFPIDPEPASSQRFQEKWHLNGDGSLCLFARVSDWTGADTAADLVEKASSWFIEYRAVQTGLISEMSAVGMYGQSTLDGLIESL